MCMLQCIEKADFARVAKSTDKSNLFHSHFAQKFTD